MSENVGYDNMKRDNNSRMPGICANCTLFLGILLAGACTPTVKLATDEPITINLNVNIKHEILVKVDKALDDVFSEDSELF